MYDFTRMSEINNYLILFFCFATAKKKQFHRFSFHPPVYGIFVTQRHRNLRFHSSIKKKPPLNLKKMWRLSNRSAVQRDLHHRLFFPSLSSALLSRFLYTFILHSVQDVEYKLFMYCMHFFLKDAYFNG